MLLKYLTVFGVSMVPLIELRGAVPIGTGLGIPWLLNLIICIVGNCLPIPFILLFVKFPFYLYCNFSAISGK